MILYADIKIWINRNQKRNLRHPFTAGVIEHPYGRCDFQQAVSLALSALSQRYCSLTGEERSVHLLQITPISAPAPLKSGLLCCVHINTADPEKKALRGKDLALLIWASDESLIRQMCGVDFRRCASVPSGTQR